MGADSVCVGGGMARRAWLNERLTTPTSPTRRDKDVLVDTSDLFRAQMAAMDEEAAARDVAGAARRQRDALLRAMGGPADGGEGAPVEEEEEEREEEGEAGAQ